MKKVFLSISVFFIFSLLQAQFYAEWTEPVAITDSLSINSNPVVLTATVNSYNDVFCFYEKKMSVDSPSQIWYQNIYLMTGEQLVLSDNNFEYRNPKTVNSSPYYDSRYFLIYESNETGNFDLYGIEFFVDGSFGSPFNLTNTPGDESSCSLGAGYEFIEACWKHEESILTSHISIVGDSLQFEEVFTIDTTNCFDPVCSQNHVLYRKIMNDSSHIYYSSFNEAENLWTVPDTIYATGNNINLRVANSSPSYFDNSVIALWENNKQLVSWENNYNTISFGEFQGIPECFEPDFLTFDLWVNFFDFPAVITFCSGEGQNREVFASAGYGSIGLNISNNSVADSNPQVFYGPNFSNYFNAISIWQSHINDNMVLYMSQISILMGSISEKDGDNNKFLKTSPNPFKNELKIDYYLSTNEEANIDIYSITGKQIHHIDIKSKMTGWNNYTWNPV
ncbi:MAG: hypothetical protein DRJ05_19840, partial [Bacteroidetes bacterium]